MSSERRIKTENYTIRRLKLSKSIVSPQNNSTQLQHPTNKKLIGLNHLQPRGNSFKRKLKIKEEFEEIGQKKPIINFISKLKRSITSSGDQSNQQSPMSLFVPQPNPYSTLDLIKSDNKSTLKAFSNKDAQKKQAQQKSYQELIKYETEKNQLIIERGFSSRPKNLKHLKQFEFNNLQFENLQFPKLITTCKQNGIFIHQMSQDDKHGRAYEFYSNGDSFVGYYQNSKRTGIGRYIFSNGDYYEGNFNHNSICGQGIMFYSNNERYIGQFQQDKKWGFGQYYYKNGDIYSGMWKNDLKHGEGCMKYASLQNLEVMCIYKENVKIKSNSNFLQNTIYQQ